MIFPKKDKLNFAKKCKLKKTLLDILSKLAEQVKRLYIIKDIKFANNQCKALFHSYYFH